MPSQPLKKFSINAQQLVDAPSATNDNENTVISSVIAETESKKPANKLAWMAATVGLAGTSVTCAANMVYGFAGGWGPIQFNNTVALNDMMLLMAGALVTGVSAFMTATRPTIPINTPAELTA